MKCLIVRFEPHRTMQPRLAAHVRGVAPPEEAVERRTMPAVLPVPGIDAASFEANRAWVVADREKKRRGKRGHEVVDVLIAGPPPIDAPNAWTEAEITAWAGDAAAAFKRGLPDGGYFTDAAIHLSEGSPHIQAQFVPRMNGRLSWSAVQKQFCFNLTGKSLPRKPDQFSALQDAFFEAFGKGYGLERGERGSKRKHQPPDRRKGLRQRVVDVQNQSADIVAASERRVAQIGADADRRVADVQRDADDKVLGAKRQADEDVAAARGSARREVDQVVEDAYLAEMDAEDDRLESKVLLAAAQADADINLQRRELSERSQKRIFEMLNAADKQRELDAREADEEEREKYERKRRAAADKEKARAAAEADTRRREVNERRSEVKERFGR